MRNKRKYRVTDHGADTGLVVYGSSYEALFENSAHALFSVITDLRRIRRKETRQFSFPEGRDALVIFLNELLYMWDADRFLIRAARVTRDGDGLRASAEGEVFDPGRHHIRKEIKAATYHGFSVLECRGGYEAAIVLDI